MHKTQEKILKCFVQNHNSPLSTSELLELVYEQELTQGLANTSQYSLLDAQKFEKQLRAKLHRKLLHHLNTLITAEVLRVHSISNKGQKLFVPLVSHNQELIFGDKEKIVLTAQDNPHTPLESNKLKDFAHLYREKSWIQKCNAILIESVKISEIFELEKLISETIHSVNDVVGVNDFETLIEKSTKVEMLRFLEFASRQAQLTDKTICIVLDFTNITDDECIMEWILSFAKIANTALTLVIDTTHREIILHKRLFEFIVHVHCQYNLKLNFKNDDIHKSPYLIGKAGPYTLPESEWRKYAYDLEKSSAVIAFTQSTVILDFAALFERKIYAKDINLLCRDIAKSLFIANTMQRKNILSVLKSSSQDIIQKRSFLSQSHSLIRLKNFLKIFEHKDESGYVAVVEDLITAVREYAQLQEHVYLTCGMPLRFDVQVSQSYRRADEQVSLSEDFSQIRVSSSQELFNEDNKRIFENIERLQTKLLAFETRIERYNIHSIKEIIGEILLLSSTYSLPFICYKFEKRPQEKMLSEYYDEVSSK